jgi:predicted ATPase
MINSLKLDNFKAFEQTGEITISPLTVIVGKNSSGKSSILHSLLLLKQTLESSNEDAVIALEGKYLKYSSLSEISNNLPPPESAGIKYTFGFSSANKKTEIEISIKNEKNKGSDNNFHPAIDKIVVIEGRTKFDLSQLSNSSVQKWISKKQKFLSDFFDDDQYHDPSIKYDHFLPKYLEVTNKNQSKGSVGRMRIPFDLIFGSASTLNNLRRSIENIKFLSPVRAKPQRAYIHYSDDTADLDEDGGNSAHVFWGKRNKEVLWLGNKYSLTEAVNLCFECMGLKQKIKPVQSGNIVYQIKVEILGQEKEVTIADVGFGYSQVIPIILTGLLNTKENLMLIEQPEIHLHPSSCANLADLFLGFVADGKRFIVETHSQDFINRLRLRVIEDPQLKDKINILFVDGDLDAKEKIQQFRIDENGLFPRWPTGFIDESEKGARALIKARTNRSTQKNIAS